MHIQSNVHTIHSAHIVHNAHTDQIQSVKTTFKRYTIFIVFYCGKYIIYKLFFLQTLDHLPLTNPENFGTPVILESKKQRKRRKVDGPDR